jgi:hypothetical protein
LGCDITVQWLNQVHGANVVEARADKQMPNADACYSRTKNLACAVMTADCLPLLITALDGSVVATAHGGWRGLAAGVITATVERLGLHPSQLSVYLGPAICAAHFEVGPEVRSVFLAKPWLKALDALTAGLLSRTGYTADPTAQAWVRKALFLYGSPRRRKRHDTLEWLRHYVRKFLFERDFRRHYIQKALSAEGRREFLAFHRERNHRIR